MGIGQDWNFIKNSKVFFLELFLIIIIILFFKCEWRERQNESCCKKNDKLDEKRDVFFGKNEGHQVHLNDVVHINKATILENNILNKRNDNLAK